MYREKVRKLVRRRWRRRGAVIVQVAVMSTVIMGFGALAIDVGLLYNSKAELQSACDSAALAAAAQLGSETGDPAELARQAAVDYAARHEILGDPGQLDTNRDVEFGRAVFNPATSKFEFQTSSFNHDAVRVTVRRTADSPGGAIPLLFANSMGVGQKDMWARATAVLIPRDIAVVIDISNSMCYDSELRFWNRADGGNSNLRDVWAALDGAEPDHPYLPGLDGDTEYAADTGPVFGQMNTWGDSLTPGAYVVANDPGLVNLPRGSKWSSSLTAETVLSSWPEHAADNALITQGYNVWERWALLTNECEGYLTAPAIDTQGFQTRAVWKKKETSTRDKLTVYVTSDGSAGTPPLTSFIISLPSSALTVAQGSATSQGSHAVQIVNPDSQTGLRGIKFTGLTLGAGGAAQTEWFSCLVPTSTSPAITSTYLASITTSGAASVQRTFQTASPTDNTRYQRRVGAVLGLNTWLSGMDGEAEGDGDGLVESDTEAPWIALPSFCAGWTWKEYIDHARASTNPSEFRGYFGLKTWVDFLLEKHPGYAQTNVLWATPEEPLRAVKDAVQAMVNVITALDSMDHMSLEVFASSARHQLDLTDDLQSIPNLLYQRQSGHWDTTTCMGGGLQKAIDELKSSRARAASAKVIVLMSDGVPNVDESGTYVGDADPAALQYVYEQAERAADEGIRIYCVSVGYQVDREVMQTVAAKGHGQEFFASGSPEQYTQELEDIFRALGGKRPVALIE